MSTAIPASVGWWRWGRPAAISAVIHAFDLLDDGFDRLIIPFGIIGLFEIAAEEEGYGLVETGIEAAFIFLDDVVAVIAGLTVDELHQYFPLIDRHLFQGLGKLFFQFFFAGFDIILPLPI